MNQLNKWRAFAAKELTETLRTKKLFALVSVFIFIALLSVLTARFMGEIFGALLSAEGALPFTIEMPDPVWTDSYAQLYSNLAEMGLIAFIMLYMGVILREKNTGTIDLMMAKGLTPTAFVMAKYAVGAILVLVTLTATVLVTYVYTFALFEYSGQVSDVLLGAVPFGVFLLMILGVTMMWSAIVKSTAISAVLGISSFFVIRLLEFIPHVGRFMPGRLIGHGVAISSGARVLHMWGQVFVALAITILTLVMTIVALRQREG